MSARPIFQVLAASAAAVLIAGAVVLIGLGRCVHDLSLEQAFQKRWGVAVVADDLQRQVGAMVSTPTRPVRLLDLHPGDERVALDLVDDAFAVYPAGFVPRVLKTVALASHIDVWGEDAGGFYHDHMIAVNFEGLEDGGTHSFDVDTVHHELSSIVRRETTFNVTTWEAANPKGFRYMSLQGYKAVLADAGPVAGDAALHRAGFVSQYGQTSLDNDWNTYAERIFGHGTEFARWLTVEPARRPKTRLLMDVYMSLDPRFTAYFQHTGLTKAASANP